MNMIFEQCFSTLIKFTRNASGIWAHTLSLSIIFIFCTFPSIYHDIARDALFNSDMDLVSVYQALLINAGQPLVPMSHTGYVYFLSLAGWFNVFDWLGILTVHDIDGLMSAKDFDSTYLSLVITGRIFSIFQAWVLVGLLYSSIFMLLKKQDWGIWISLIFSIIFAIGGGGISAHSVMMRTELLSMILIFSSAIALMVAPKLSFNRGYWLLGMSGFLVHAAMMVKIQNIIVIIFLPLLPLVFGYWERQNIKDLLSNKFMWVLSALSVLLLIFILIVFLSYLTPGSYSLYQGLIVIFIISCALLFGRWNFGAARYGGIGLGAVAIGFSLAYSLNFFNENWWTPYSVVNFLEQMMLYSNTTGEASTLQNTNGVIDKVARAISVGLSQKELVRFFNERFQNLDYPFMVFYILVPAFVLILAFKRKWEAAFKAGFLCLMSGTIVGIFWVGRGFFNFYYSVYVEIWMILAAAIVFKELIQISISWPKYWLFTAKIGLLIFMVFLITINVRFRILDATTANPVVAKSACFVRGLTPLLYNKFDDYCGTG